MDFNNNDNKMDIKIALEILEISEDELTKIDQDYIKKQYHKMALKWHPDKNPDKNATDKFQRIGESYQYLSKELCFLNDETNSNTSNTSNTYNPFVSEDTKMYTYILSTFISSLLKGDYNELFTKVIKEIVIGYNVLSLTYLQKIFEDLDKQKSIDIYNFLCKYRDILYIQSDVLELVSSIIKEKCKNDSIVILNPSLKDILENNIYKLYVENELYLVPLWHNELYFDAPDGSEIVVLCQPDIPENIRIDENNNLHITKEINLYKELPNLILNDPFVSLEVGGKWVSIPLQKLFMKKEQIYRFEGQGIAHILEKDIYNISVKADIIVKILLVE